jgi:hypothetical protein
METLKEFAIDMLIVVATWLALSVPAALDEVRHGRNDCRVEAPLKP